MTALKGTHVEVTFSRVVDGDTIRVALPGAAKDESLRILCLDTEESHSGGGKPVTPWGHAAKARAEDFFQGVQTLVIEFPGDEPLTTCVEKYRGNYGRLLVYVHREGVDYQETMIQEGYSPYFVKYGRAQFAGHHRRYVKAEQTAQRQRLGVWDQMGVNGGERRNYAALGCWWQLRGRIIEDYRRVRALDDSILNPRLDYARISAMARGAETATIFTEMRTVTRVGGHSGLIGMGSVDRPFNLFLPDMDSEAGRAVVNLLEARYISSGEERPKRSYAYVTGKLGTYRDRPQLVVNSADQIGDGIEAREDTPAANLAIAALLPDPVGPDAGFESVTLRNRGSQAVSLESWQLRDLSGHTLRLNGQLAAGKDRAIKLQRGQLPLNNTGDNIYLLGPEEKVQHQVAYAAGDVLAGEQIWFVSE